MASLGKADDFRADVMVYPDDVPIFLTIFLMKNEWLFSESGLTQNHHKILTRTNAKYRETDEKWYDFFAFFASFSRVWRQKMSTEREST